MTPEDIAAKAAADAKAKEDADAKAKADAEATPQDPLKTELEKVKKPAFTEAEKAAYNLRKNADRAIELGLDPSKVLGFPETEEMPEDDDAPVTVGMLKKSEQRRSERTALQMADAIENEHERDLVKHYLENNIRPSGNPVEDLKFAREHANSVKNRQLLEEAARKNQPVRNGTGSGAPAKDQGEIFEPTAEEMSYMRPPFNMTKEEILKARPKA